MSFTVVSYFVLAFIPWHSESGLNSTHSLALLNARQRRLQAWVLTALKRSLHLFEPWRVFALTAFLESQLSSYRRWQPSGYDILVRKVLWNVVDARWQAAVEMIIFGESKRLSSKESLESTELRYVFLLKPDYVFPNMTVREQNPHAGNKEINWAFKIFQLLVAVNK